MARPRVRPPSPAPRSQRLVSWWWDYLLILAWLAVIFLLIGLPQILGWLDLSAIWTDQVAGDIAITVLTVLPYFLYLTVTEWRPPHATLGKRRAGITVIGKNGEPPGSGAVLVRNLVKVLPWQLGHMGTTRLIYTTEVTTAAISFQTASLAFLALVVVPILFGKAGIHDLLAGTRVTSAE
ncbi:MAG: RDD family protein [Acidimicrobiia bacterium]